jgi:diacylglycerol kinase
LFATVVVIFLGFYFNVSQSEWLWLVLAIGIVLIIEVVNTAIEKLVDIQFPTLNPKAGIIKDIAAAGVLLAAATALIIGAIIFYKYIF